MKVIVSKDNLLHGVQVVQRAVAAKNPLPVLSGILLKAFEGHIVFSATDLELGIECIIPATVEEQGGVVLPAKYFSEIVRRLPDMSIEIESNKEKNNILIKYGQSEFNLLILPEEDFPVLPMIDSNSVFTIKQEQFKTMIKQVSFATSNDDNRPIFTGILMEISQGNIRLVATDTHRLAYRNDVLENTEESLEKSVIIPGKTLNELNRIMTGEGEDIKIAFGDNQVVFEMPGIKFISRLIEGQFPNYRQVIPQGCKTKIRVKTKDFLESSERASLLAKEGSNVIKLNVEEDYMLISSNSPDIGKIEEQVPIELDGEKTQIAFNSKYLIDVIKIIDTDEMMLELTGSLSPGIIKPKDNESYISLILPIRIV
ncbi:DNA polymerase III subunit beta [Phosphitispora sp. TUW77]|uniref:DNA polymerase III subunit beta n=1 Tax=Phosphitispora sp. TUW77 TaxID=3152361 RepID=UPI003AB8B20E